MSRKRTVDQLLANVPLFAACSPAELGRIGRLCTPVDISAGTVLVREGSSGHEMFVIAAGTATVTIGGDVVAEVGPGDVFGEMALLDGGQRTATVTATTDMVVEVLSQPEFLSLLAEVPAVTRKVLRQLAARLRVADAQLVA
jgi:CRP-like cAMP-binding protein